MSAKLFVVKAHKPGTFAKISSVFAAHRRKCRNTPCEFDNDFGCGNCGDMGVAFRTLHMLAEAMADSLKLKGDKRKTFLAACKGE